jgi:sugar lactone lactonase YvrE
MMVYYVICEERDRVGESPVWSPGEQALYWVDIEGRRIRRCQPQAAAECWELPERVGCIALAADGRVIAAMESGIAALKLEGQGQMHVEWLARIEHPASNMRFNDGRCDAAGRLWVGTMVMDMSLAAPQGGLYCLDERGLTGPYVSDLITPNGLGFSPDHKTLYLSDSHPQVQKIWAFDFDLATGTLSNRRLFVDMSALPGRPDGAAVDADGNYWICGNDAGQIHCFASDGSLQRSLAVPVPKPSMCAFGGAGLDTLFVTSIPPADPAQDPSGLSGRLLALEPEAVGLPEPLFTRFPPTA